MYFSNLSIQGTFMIPISQCITVAIVIATVIVKNLESEKKSPSDLDS